MSNNLLTMLAVIEGIMPEALRLADDLEASSLFPGNMRSCNNAAAAELRRLHAELETLRMGYAAARLEIESLRAAQPTGAQQPSPTPQADSQPAPYEIINMAREQGLPETETEGVFRVNVDDLGRIFASYRAARAPADSGAAPAGGVVAYLDIGAGGYLDLGTDLTDEALSRLPKGRHALVIAGTYGIDGYIAAPTTQPAPVRDRRTKQQMTAERLASSVTPPAPTPGAGRQPINRHPKGHRNGLHPVPQ